MSEAIRVAVIGLGEAGSLIAEGLHSAGLHVAGFDSAGMAHSPVPVAASVDEAVVGAHLVISINSPLVSRRVAEQCAPLLEPDAVYADLNTGTPAHKRALAALFPEGAFVDGALRPPVAGRAEGGSLSVAGTGARRLIEMLEPSGMHLEYVSDIAGDAAARTLIRSMLTTGLAGVLIDCLWAAESMGLQEWAYREILDEFESASSETAKGYLSGTAQHIKRQQIEMMDVVEMLGEAGYASSTIEAVGVNYSRILHGKKIPFSKPNQKSAI
jgi:3-hydroxyisobutyrate dehydrogenase-like beta-hydroxyacid dehydrogenase